MREGSKFTTDSCKQAAEPSDTDSLQAKRQSRANTDFSITNYQLPITNYQLPIINYQLPIINYQLSITNYQLPITNYQLSIINYQWRLRMRIHNRKQAEV
jgi:hypothetical protein